eukprot:TRINITY_DN9737_c0_g1_i2.p1 TRINITY_DN9737_c0_g1~~TRINITY_DN9737_c0_g1_i2.p1  ORF type:complete len:187 (+),score=34.06 TRINITY_DN9737_c0_g1_i2:170-730(+)
MNIAAALSQNGDHQNSLEHSKMAINKCMIALKQNWKNIQNNQELAKEYSELVQTLVISHHNCGVEQEQLGYIQAGQKSFQEAVKISSQHFGADHQLTVKCKTKLQQFQQSNGLQQQGSNKNLFAQAKQIYNRKIVFNKINQNAPVIQAKQQKLEQQNILQQQKMNRSKYPLIQEKSQQKKEPISNN